MAENDINYLTSNNTDCTVEKDGVQQRASVVFSLQEGGCSVAQDFLLGVSMGKFPGFSTLDKFGVNNNITTSTDPEDIWEGGGLYSYDADGTAPIVSVISTESGDTQDIKITGLDINREEVTQTITLTGETRKALDTPLWRVYRMENEGSTDLTGTVYCYIGTGGAPAIGNQRALIANGNNQTLMAIYTIPKGKVGFLYRGELGVLLDANPSQAQNFCKAYYQSRRFGKVFKIKKVITLMTAGSSNFQDYRSFPDVIPASTDVRLTAAQVGITMGMWGTFDILLVDETMFTAEYLQKIGQPGY